jgi:hypothetical protein
MIWLLPHPSPVIKLDHRQTEKERQPADGRGDEGGAKNHTTSKSLVLYTSFNNLWRQSCHVTKKFKKTEERKGEHVTGSARFKR